MAKMGQDITEEIYSEFLQLLRDLNDSQALDKSKRKFSCLVSERVIEKHQQTEVEILREVLIEILALVEKERPEYGEILRGRFWEGFKVSEMLDSGRPWAVEVNRDERTFLYHQRKAVTVFAFWFMNKEKACEEKKKILALKELETKPKIRKRTLNIKWLITAIVLIVGISIVFGSILNYELPFDTNAPDSSETEDLTPPSTKISFTPTAHRAITFTQIYTSVCGESYLFEDTPQGPRFIANQGVSSFTVENTPNGILNNRVRALASIPNGLLIGYFQSESSTNGLTYLDLSEKKKKWGKCNEGGITYEKLVNDIAVDQESHIWIATDGGGIILFDGDTWHGFEETKEKIPINLTYGITIDKNNEVWASTFEGVTKFDGKEWELVYSVEGELISNHVHAIAFDGKNNIWIGHIWEGVSQFNNSEGKWMHYTSDNSEIGGNYIRGIVVQQEYGTLSESIWLATEDGGVSKFEDGEWEVFGIEDGIPSQKVLTIAVDSLNRIWIGTDNGVVFFDGEWWTQYNELHTLSIAFTPGCPNHSCPQDDHVWTGTEEMGLTHSRLPYPDAPIKITQICFESFDRELTCPSLNETQHPQTIAAVYPRILTPGEMFNFRIEVIPLGNYELRSDRGDFLSYIGDNLENMFGAYPIIPVIGTIESGQFFVFSNRENMMIAPELPPGTDEMIYVSTWRVWKYTRYVGPEIRIIFTVKQSE